MIAKLNDPLQAETSRCSLVEYPMTSSSIRNGDGGSSPLRILLRSIQSTDSSIFSGDVLDAAQTYRKKVVRKERENNTMSHIDHGLFPLSLTLDKMALGAAPNHSNDSLEVPSAGKDPDIFVQNGKYKQPLSSHYPETGIPKDFFSALPMTSKIEKKERCQKANTSAQGTKETVSFDTLNKLMEVTASSRCLLLQQTNESCSSSAPLMKSLSEVAFKSIMSSTTITSSTSANSFRKTSTALATSTTSDFINCSFEDTSHCSQQEPKKPRTISGLEPELVGLTKYSSRRSKRTKAIPIKDLSRDEKSLTRSLPSCGSLESSESESYFDEMAREASLPLPVKIGPSIDVTPIGEKYMICNSTGHSTEKLVRSFSLENDRSYIESTQSLSSFSRVNARGTLQTKRKFNSFQGPVDRDNRFSGSGLGQLSEDLDRKNGNKHSSKISPTMKLQLRQELQRMASQSRPQQSNDYNWLL